MTNRSMIIIGDNRPGLLAEMTELLSSNGIDIQNFVGDLIDQYALFKLTPDPYEEAFQLLEQAGFQVIANHSLLVCLRDEAGALARLSRQLADAAIETRSMHFVAKKERWSLVAVEVEVDQLEEARDVLADIVI